jgi:7-cyano-7-deazaguanine synthase
MIGSKALVVFSGGQDSTTCLFWAMRKFGLSNLRTVTFDYGQRHQIEINSARKICESLNLEFDLIAIPEILRTSSPLIDKRVILEQHDSIDSFKSGLQATFVPGRNILFLTIAANIARHYEIDNLVIGVCEEDYGGYYDCRDEFIRAMNLALNQGLYGSSQGLTIHTPLMSLSKADTVRLAMELGEKCLAALGLSHTCYNGTYPPCGTCHACLLRARGFAEAGILDPLNARANN